MPYCIISGGNDLPSSGLIAFKCRIWNEGVNTFLPSEYSLLPVGMKLSCDWRDISY